MDNVFAGNCTVFLDTTSNVLQSAGTIILEVINQSNSTVHIINFNREKIKKGTIITGVKNYAKTVNKPDDEMVSRIVFEQDLKKDFAEIIKYCSKCKPEDYIIIIGGERLIPYIGTSPVIKSQYSKMKISFHTMDNENWKGFAKEVDNLYKNLNNVNQNIVIFAAAYEIYLDNIVDAFSDYPDITIGTVSVDSEKNKEYTRIQKEIFEVISNENLTRSLEVIEYYKDKLDNTTYKYLTSLAYIKNGDRQKAIELLESFYEQAENREKILLADLYTSAERGDKAFKILKEIYDKDCFETDLMPAMLRAVEKLDDEAMMDFWINEALKVDSEHPAVLEFAANYYNSKKQYREAANIRRKIANILNDPFHELIARILDLIDNPPSRAQDAEGYIDSLLLQYPHLESEANYRLGRYFLDFKSSPFTAYSRLKMVPAEIGISKAMEAAERRFFILKDVEFASKALRKIKPFEKDRDAHLLGKERTSELLKNIKVLALRDNGYLIWRDFIDQTQPISIWKKFIYSELISRIHQWNSLDFDEIKDKSYINKIDKEISSPEDMKSSDAIKILRYIKKGTFHREKLNDEIKQIIYGVLCYFEMQKDIVGKYWARYYAAICYSLLGEHQDANNYSLSLLQFASSEEVEADIKRCLMLGLMSWGYSQYRIGNQVEGISCIISAIELGIEINEIYPFLEDGTNIIYRFFSDNIDLINTKDKELIGKFLDKLSTNSKNEIINKHSLLGNWNEVYNQLSQKVNSDEEKDGEWAGHLATLINSCIELNKIDEAGDLILKYSKLAIPLLASRLDIRYRILLTWAELIIMHSKIKMSSSLDLVLELLEISIEDIEKRRQVYHKTERAYIGEAAQVVYKFYIQILVLFYNTKDFDKEKKVSFKKKIESTLGKLTPRAIFEQKYYFENKKITDDIIKIEEEYKILTDELKIQQQRSEGNFEIYREKAKRAADLLEILKTNHPHYSSLKNYENVSFEVIRRNLHQDEMFYQYIRTKFGITYILLTPEIEQISFSFVEPEQIVKIDEILKALGIALQKDYKDIDTILAFCEFLSEAFYTPLLEYLVDRKIDKVYILSDNSTTFFSPNLIRSKGRWLIEKVSAIENIIDYNAIKNREQERLFGNLVIGKAFGKQQDAAINDIRQWMNSYKGETQFIALTDSDNNIGTLENICEKEKPKVLIISGHGVPDPNSGIFDGAVALEGNKKIIWIEDLADVFKYCENLILISCRGGIPFEDQIETNTGIWGSILERPISRVIMCKWDVPVKSTIKILNSLVKSLPSFDWDLPRALLAAQKELIKNSDCNPSSWAGLECWKN